MKNFKVFTFLLLIILISCSEQNEQFSKPEEKLKVNLSTLVEPTNAGEVSVESGTYDKGEIIVLEAIPYDGFEFVRWKGGISGQENPIKFTIETDKNIISVFEKISYSLDFSIVGTWFIGAANDNRSTMTERSRQAIDNDCGLLSIQFREDGTFLINTDEGEIEGEYSVTGPNSIDLEEGELTELNLSEEGVLHFNLLWRECNSDVIANLQTYVPDDVFERKLIELGLDSELDDYVVTRNIDTVKKFKYDGTNKPANEKIKNLIGIEDFIELRDLRVPYNEISEIDISQNTNLSMLLLSGNNLTSIDISNNSRLDTFWLDYNKFVNIELRNIGGYGYFNLTGNPLKTVHLENISTGEFNIDQTSVETIKLLNVNASLVWINYNENLESLIVENTSVSQLYYSRNPLIDLDLSKFHNLDQLDIRNSPSISNLDVSMVETLSYAYILNNENLSCIKINSSQLDSVHWEIDEGIELAEECN